MSDSDDRSHSDERLSQFSSSSRSPSFDHGTDSSPADKTVFYSASQDNEFLILEDLPGSGHLRDKTQESIRVINGDEIVLIDNYLKGMEICHFKTKSAVSNVISGVSYSFIHSSFNSWLSL